MKLLTSYIPEPARSAIRFLVIGTTGSFAQTGFFLLVMALLGQPEEHTLLYNIAFGAGNLLEMIPNYLLTNWYIFSTRPSLKNAGGYLFARAINLVIQLGLLPLVLLGVEAQGWAISSGLVCMIVIFIGGVINYFIQRMFFKNPA